MRKHYLDNIRWAAVILVLVYHVFYLFNGVGVLGGLGGFREVQYQDSFLYFVYPWFMALLFVIAGISSRYSLSHRTSREFIGDRTRRLLIPSTLGLFAFQWITGYMNILIGGGLDLIPTFIRYPVMVLSGIGPLWFMQVLFIFSLLLVLIKKMDGKDKFYTICGKAGYLPLLLLGILLFGGAQILNAPVITTYRFGIYFVAFLLGYFVFSHEEVEEKLSKMHLPMLALAVLTGISYTIYYFGSNYAEDAVLKSIFTNVYAWIAILAILGCGRAWFDKTNAFADYMKRSSTGIYIVHYPIVLIFGYLLKNHTGLPVVFIYVFAVIGVLVFSPLLFEVLKRIPIIRYLVLGIKKD